MEAGGRAGGAFRPYRRTLAFGSRIIFHRSELLTQYISNRSVPIMVPSRCSCPLQRPQKNRLFNAHRDAGCRYSEHKGGFLLANRLCSRHPPCRCDRRKRSEPLTADNLFVVRVLSPSPSTVGFVLPPADSPGVFHTPRAIIGYH